MSAEQYRLESKPEGGDACATPFSLETVTLTKQDYIQLICERNSFQRLHARAVKRSQWYQKRCHALLHYAKAQTSKREVELGAELATAHAKIRELNQRVFGRHSERSKGRNEAQRGAKELCNETSAWTPNRSQESWTQHAHRAA